MKKNLLLLLISLFVSIGLTEIGIRIFFADALPVKDHRDDMFWVADRDVGWTKRPDSSGFFSNGLYNGYVVNDRYGNRRNSDTGTYMEGYENIFFIGDSTTVSLEVNNRETVPAVLERHLRSQGKNVNVLNFGVRGYGTDQSVRKALAFSKQYAPVEIIYMYCDNDMIDNNTVKRSYRKFGKGVYIKKSARTGFQPFNYPVPEYKYNYAAMVVFDDQGVPFIHEALLPEKDPVFREKEDRLKLAAKRHFYLLRAVGFLQDSFKCWRAGPLSASLPRDTDPYRLIQSGAAWREDFSLAFLDGADIRLKYRDYFLEQMTFLLSKLRTIRSVKKVHVVWFPSVNEIQLLKENKSANSVLFQDLFKAGVVDSFVNLNRRLMEQKVDIHDLRAKGDHHFSYRGNRWIAAQITDRIKF